MITFENKKSAIDKGSYYFLYLISNKAHRIDGIAYIRGPDSSPRKERRVNSLLVEDYTVKRANKYRKTRNDII